MSIDDVSLEVHQLTKRFGNIVAVNNISFTVRKDEIVGLLGPNGAGKTTTIRMITGVLPYTPPSMIKVFGQELKANAHHLKTFFGVIPEVSNAFLDYTVSKNVSFAAKINGQGRNVDTGRMNSLLEEFGLMEKKDAQAKTLSKGLKQRLSFCMNLVHDPAFLILDEPTSGLDPLSVQILRDMILKLREDGKTILLTSHDMKEVAKVCNRAIIMNHGEIIANDAPSNLRGLLGGQKQIAFKPENALEPDQFLGLQAQVSTGEILTIPSTSFLTFRTNNPLEDFTGLNNFCISNQIKIVDVRLDDATLEDAFIHLIKTGGKKDV
ncbi:MAG TPA: ABC transporter ATP-binding protein [Candidatus Lokiarchaeia archaeon]|nr:ABC transporter ATP-binding protein [Candidatus Lokiarchaeia archaeon]